jgi:hypothetical protein
MAEIYTRLETQLVHAGAVEMPIFQSATYTYAGETRDDDVRSPAQQQHAEPAGRARQAGRARGSKSRAGERQRHGRAQRKLRVPHAAAA